MEEILRDLPRHGTLVKDRGYRQIWRFQAGGQSYYLKLYPHRRWRWKRLIRGNPAMREFKRLQQLQKAGIPAPRAISALVGFSLQEKLGDCVVIEAIEPGVTLDQYLNEFKLRGEPIPDHRGLVRQVIEIVSKLGRAGLGHADLHLGNFLLFNGKLYLLDGYAVRPGGLKLEDVLLLGHSVSRFATRTDYYRGWLELGGTAQMPRINKVSQRQWRKMVERAEEENDWFGPMSIGQWRGYYFKRSKYARRWAPASSLQFSDPDWRKVWPELWRQIETQTAQPLKRSRSGDVWTAHLDIGNNSLEVVVKRPYKRYWYRYINEIGRGSRARRAWRKSWKLIARNIPTAWPLLLLEKRTLGYVTDSMIVFEKIPGPTLASVDLDSLGPHERDMLFRRTGKILNQIDSRGLSHFDAKASNWIVSRDEKLGPRPILIDVDGVRARRWIALGIQRLLRSMREHPQYTPADSLALCRGYAPFSRALVQKDKASPL
jgi:tRNA A-37 threonylcarbamoyl transferase component Bud32